MSQIPVDEPIPAPAGAEVAVLIHDHRHGVDVQVHASYDAAVRARANIARDGWAALADTVDELPARPPVDDIEAAERYFAHLDDEDASIRILTIEPDPTRPGPAGDAPATDPALAGLLAMLPTLNAGRAYAVLHRLTSRQGWQYALWDATDVEAALMVYHWPPDRHLTTAEWAAVRATRAWAEIGDIAGQRVADSDVLHNVVRQAGLVCVDCTALITGPLTATWGRCDTCRTRPVAEMQAEPCPASTVYDHEWAGRACADCGLPAPEQVTCARCHGQVPLATAHRHHGTWVGDACCWDERRRTTV